MDRETRCTAINIQCAAVKERYALHYAIRGSNVENVQALIDAISLSNPDVFGNMPLHTAIGRISNNTVVMLKRWMLLPEMLQEHIHTPNITATTTRDERDAIILIALLRNGADIEALNTDGVTAASADINDSKTEPIVRQLFCMLNELDELNPCK
ncbi:hypothetical protein BC938DRAFT_470757 [Jimgerdemannia flammicorona]|uniref:Uncharacterized protein n=1 Tax=Jimgerdemannia flammicorona TaxID=994334 RepID=A0A433Q9P9_9FUNG|nr:hypothetical protein BC938DRAFT_470757 [Jimgerdemannia flammicorona]